MNTYSFNPKKGFFSHGIAYGKTIWIKFDEKLEDLHGVTFDSLYEVIINFKEDYVIDRHAFRGTKRISIDIKLAELGNNQITNQKIFKDNFKLYLCEANETIVDAYKKAYWDTVRDYNPCKIVPEKSLGAVNYCLKIVDAYINKTVTFLERYLLNQRAKDKKEDHIMLIDNLKKEHLYNLSKQTKGILVKNFDKNDQLDFGFYRMFDIPIMKCNGDFSLIRECGIITYNKQVFVNPDEIQKLQFENECLAYKDTDLAACIKRHKRIKVYAPIIDNRFIDEVVNSTLYEGVGLYQSEYDFITYGLVPDSDILYETYKIMIDKLSKKGKEVIFRLPDMRPEKSEASFGNLTLDLVDYREYPEIFKACLEAFAKACNGYDKVSVVVPMIMAKTEVKDWRQQIEKIFEEKKQKKPKIGIMVETEAAFDHIEDYFRTKQDFIVIGLNDLIEEIHEIDRTDDISLIDFKRDIMMDLRELHRVLRLASVRHICTGNILSNPKIFDKLIKMGYNEFCIPIEASVQSHKIIDEHFKNIGRYVGEFKRQLEKRDYRNMILRETGRKPKNNYPKLKPRIKLKKPNKGFIN